MSKATKGNSVSVEAMLAQTKRDTLVALIAAHKAAVDAWGGELALPSVQQSQVLQAAAAAFQAAGGDDGAYSYTRNGDVATGISAGEIKAQVEALGFNINNNGQQCIHGMGAQGVYLSKAPKGGYIIEPAMVAVFGGAK
tara:strand:- start:738 stop:1154 length:417 start_codon:yes stop_codon:yes gene_type:complete